MESQSPLVSIGLPVYNGENFVAEAISCVLAQTFTNFELIISDNASTDGTMNICQEFARKHSRIRLYRNERNLGVSPNYNHLFQLSRGRYFAWLPHDDLFGPEYIQTCVLELEKNHSAVLVFPKLVYVDAQRRPLRRQISELSVSGPTATSRIIKLMKLEMQGTDIFWSQFGLIRRDVLRQTHLMNFYAGSDQVLLLELALRGNLKQVDKEMFFRREHSTASTLRTGWTARERAVFAYADDKRTLVFPNFRLMKEHLLCIRGSSLPIWDKVRSAAAVLKRFLSQWKYFAHEAIDSPLEYLKAKGQKDAQIEGRI